MQPDPKTPASSTRGPKLALALLLGINLLNYIDRYVLAALERPIRDAFGLSKSQTGALASAFLISYMLAAPLFGWLADRWSRWMLIGVSVAVWSLASGWTGMAGSFGILVATRMFVGIGEAGYGPSAPSLISDYFPVSARGKVMSLFYVAIPVGSALGYVFGGIVGAKMGWQWAFFLLVIPGLILAALCFLLRDPRGKVASGTAHKASLAEYLALLRIPSYLLNTAAMTAMTFAIGGISFWMPTYISEGRAAEFHVLAGSPPEKLLGEVNTIFGAIVVVAGLISTLLGGWLGDRLRVRYAGAYFFVSGVGILLAFPALLAVLYTPFPYAWGFVFLAVFFLFFNTGPANTALANVTTSAVRSTAFALNILIIHALGDVLSPPFVGWVSERTSMNTAFMLVSLVMVVGSVLWFIGARYLGKDTEAAERAQTLEDGPA